MADTCGDQMIVIEVQMRVGNSLMRLIAFEF